MSAASGLQHPLSGVATSRPTGASTVYERELVSVIDRFTTELAAIRSLHNTPTTAGPMATPAGSFLQDEARWLEREKDSSESVPELRIDACYPICGESDPTGSSISEDGGNWAAKRGRGLLKRSIRIMNSCIEFYRGVLSNRNISTGSIESLAFDIERRKLYADAISAGSVGSTIVFGFAVSSLIDGLHMVGESGELDGYLTTYFILITGAVGLSALSTIVSAVLVLSLNAVLATLGKQDGTDYKELRWRIFSLTATQLVVPMVMVAPILSVCLVMAAVCALELRYLTKGAAIVSVAIIGVCILVMLTLPILLHGAAFLASVPAKGIDGKKNVREQIIPR